MNRRVVALVTAGVLALTADSRGGVCVEGGYPSGGGQEPVTVWVTTHEIPRGTTFETRRAGWVGKTTCLPGLCRSSG